jgi:uncharacterized protein (DUF433 family)
MVKMTSVGTAYKHVVLDDRGVPMIEGTTTKVIELVLSHLAYGWSPDELVYQVPVSVPDAGAGPLSTGLLVGPPG